MSEQEKVVKILLPTSPPTIAPHQLTQPVRWKDKIVCNDECETCPLYLKGCAGICTRFPDKVCEGCPCLNSKFA